MNRPNCLVLATLAAVAAPGSHPAAARPAAATFEAAVPDRPWYPPGYRDMRIAALGVMTAFPREKWAYEGDYDVIDCNLGYDLPEEDWRTRQYQELALDIARMRTELKKLGYRPEIYDRPLIDYERGVLADLPSAKPPPPFDPDALPAADEASAADGSDVVAEANDTAGSPPGDVEDAFYPFGDLQHVAQAMEANRARLQPGKPPIVWDGGCGGGGDDFTIALSPANGRLWLINAFAFKVCERKVPDPWDHGACGWSEYSAGDSAVASGRYMYEARWPDGSMRRGARIFTPDPDREDQSVVFRRN